MCTKTLNCPQHTDEMRELLRFQLLGKHVDMNRLRDKYKTSKRQRSAAAKNLSAKVGVKLLPTGVDLEANSFSLSDESPVYVDIDGIDEIIDDNIYKYGAGLESHFDNATFADEEFVDVL